MFADFTKTLATIEQGYKDTKEKVSSTTNDHQSALTNLRKSMAETRAQGEA